MGDHGRLKYTLGFIYCAESQQMLLLNRNKLPWMGKWNGVGGKLETDETPYECIVREAEEETALKLPQFTARGSLIWEVSENNNIIDIGGLYLFTANITKSEMLQYQTPKAFPEGILEWKSFDWVTHKDNLGIVDNVKLLFTDYDLLNTTSDELFKVKYNNHILTSFENLKSSL